MPGGLYFNGQMLTKPYFNGTQITNALFNGHKIWIDSAPNPFSPGSTFDQGSFRFQFYTDSTASTPGTGSVTVNSALIGKISYSTNGGTNYTVYTGGYIDTLNTSPIYFKGDNSLMSLVSQSFGTAQQGGSGTSNYFKIFGRISDLTPRIQAGSPINTGAYDSAFKNLTKMLQGPALDVDLPNSGLYPNIFENCSDLQEIWVGWTVWNTNMSLDMVVGVGPVGDFYHPASLNIPSGSSSYPSTWTEHLMVGY